ncbi:MAG: DUF362 domain-containing protein, partial [Candidatus Eisenbacteria bacterium]|nr:DUF362 domain-containing protein [Candidatus Eisenbacteria bacterium]
MLLDRRSFLKRTATVGAGLFASQLPFRPAFASGFRSGLGSGLGLGLGLGSVRERFLPEIDLVIARGASPARNVLAAIDALGGMAKFVRPGDRVTIKANPVGNAPPEQAVCTHPEMVGAVVRECLRVGAQRVVVASHDEPRAMQANGTAAAVTREGGILRPLGLAEHFERILVPRGRVLPEVGLAKEVLESDVFINMPIAKHHAATRYTGAMKNLMGIVWDRLHFHACLLYTSDAADEFR